MGGRKDMSNKRQLSIIDETDYFSEEGHSINDKINQNLRQVRDGSPCLLDNQFDLGRVSGARRFSFSKMAPCVEEYDNLCVGYAERNSTNNLLEYPLEKTTSSLAPLVFCEAVSQSELGNGYNCFGANKGDAMFIMSSTHELSQLSSTFDFHGNDHTKDTLPYIGIGTCINNNANTNIVPQANCQSTYFEAASKSEILDSGIGRGNSDTIGNSDLSRTFVGQNIDSIQEMFQVLIKCIDGTQPDKQTRYRNFEPDDACKTSPLLYLMEEKVEKQPPALDNIISSFKEKLYLPNSNSKRQPVRQKSRRTLALEKMSEEVKTDAGMILSPQPPEDKKQGEMIPSQQYQHPVHVENGQFSQSSQFAAKGETISTDSMKSRTKEDTAFSNSTEQELLTAQVMKHRSENKINNSKPLERQAENAASPHSLEVRIEEMVACHTFEQSTMDEVVSSSLSKGQTFEEMLDSHKELENWGEEDIVSSNLKKYRKDGETALSSHLEHEANPTLNNENHTDVDISSDSSVVQNRCKQTEPIPMIVPPILCQIPTISTSIASDDHSDLVTCETVSVNITERNQAMTADDKANANNMHNQKLGDFDDIQNVCQIQIPTFKREGPKAYEDEGEEPSIIHFKASINVVGQTQNIPGRAKEKNNKFLCVPSNIQNPSQDITPNPVGQHGGQYQKGSNTLAVPSSFESSPNSQGQHGKAISFLNSNGSIAKRPMLRHVSQPNMHALKAAALLQKSQADVNGNQASDTGNSPSGESKFQTKDLNTDLAKLKATAVRLKLVTRRPSYLEWLEERRKNRPALGTNKSHLDADLAMSSNDTTQANQNRKESKLDRIIGQCQSAGLINSPPRNRKPWRRVMNINNESDDDDDDYLDDSDCCGSEGSSRRSSYSSVESKESNSSCDSEVFIKDEHFSKSVNDFINVTAHSNEPISARKVPPETSKKREQVSLSTDFEIREWLNQMSRDRLTPARKERINKSLEWLRNELKAMRCQDQTLARQLLALRHEMHKLRLSWSCQEHRDLLDEVQNDLEDFKEFSQVLDLPSTVHLDTPLKNVGVTKLNISERRFSTC